MAISFKFNAFYTLQRHLAEASVQISEAKSKNRLLRNLAEAHNKQKLSWKLRSSSRKLAGSFHGSYDNFL